MSQYTQPSFDASSQRVRFPTLRLGYVALNDALPFILAKEKGIFSRYGLDVHLSREIGWATIRDKIEFGELDAAQALAPIPFAAALGLNHRQPIECLVSLVINLNGNAITLSRSLGQNVEEQIHRLKNGDFSHRSFGVPTLAIVSEYSSHHYLLQRWLRKHGIHPRKDVHIVVLPPNQMPMVIMNGHIDGFCAGEPWNSLAVANGSGSIAASSLDIDPGHVEKVLMVSHAFATRRSESHIRLIAAILEANEYCSNMEERTAYAAILSSRKYLNCDAEIIRIGLEGRLSTYQTPNLGVLASQFLRFDQNRPSSRHSKWILRQMKEAGQLDQVRFDPDQLSRIVFAEEYFESAVKLKKQMESHLVEAS